MVLVFWFLCLYDGDGSGMGGLTPWRKGGKGGWRRREEKGREDGVYYPVVLPILSNGIADDDENSSAGSMDGDVSGEAS